MMESLGIDWVCLTAGSPYYNPHIQRPALFPPSDGYLPPEDPLVGVARQIAVVGMLKQEFPRLAIVGSGYSYLQEWLPSVGQAAVREGLTDFVGLGRMVLSYPELPADVLAGKPMTRQLICRTFSDCTSGPRNGLVSGCFPLDPFYKSHPDAEKLKALQGTASYPMTSTYQARQLHVATTAFVALFSIVGVALYGLPFFYDFMVRDFGWTRREVTSGNAYSKLIIGPLFGFLAGWMVDRFGPRRLMLGGIVMAGLALIGLGSLGAHRHRPQPRPHTDRVLRVLPVQRARLRLRRPAAQSSPPLPLVRPRTRQSHGLRLPRHRRRRRHRPTAGRRTDRQTGMAHRPSTPRRTDHRLLPPIRTVRTRQPRHLRADDTRT